MHCLKSETCLQPSMPIAKQGVEVRKREVYLGCHWLQNIDPPGVLCCGCMPLLQHGIDHLHHAIIHLIGWKRTEPHNNCCISVQDNVETHETTRNGDLPIYSIFHVRFSRAKGLHGMSKRAVREKGTALSTLTTHFSICLQHRPLDLIPQNKACKCYLPLLPIDTAELQNHSNQTPVIKKRSKFSKESVERQRICFGCMLDTIHIITRKK